MVSKMVKVNDQVSIEVTASYGYKTEFGMDVEDKKSIITTAIVFKDGTVIATLWRTDFFNRLSAVPRSLVLAAEKDAIAELTGVTAEESAKISARKAAEAADYDRHCEIMRKAMSY